MSCSIASLQHQTLGLCSSLNSSQQLLFSYIISLHVYGWTNNVTCDILLSTVSYIDILCIYVYLCLYLFIYLLMYILCIFYIFIYIRVYLSSFASHGTTWRRPLRTPGDVVQASTGKPPKEAKGPAGQVADTEGDINYAKAPGNKDNKG